MSTIAEITALVTAFRSETQQSAISPERLGALLQKIVDYVGDLDDSEFADVVDSLVDRAPSLSKQNLFDPSEVELEKLLDNTYGKIGDWSYASKGEWTAVAKVPVTKNKYYCIINPYMTKPPTRIGVMNRATGRDWGNSTAHNIILAGRKYIIAKAEYVSDVPIDTITFVLYRQLAKVTETPLVEVYEMDSISDAVSYINSRFGETLEISPGINIERKLLSSKTVGTLSSKYLGKTMVVFGDSLTYYGGWVNYVRDALKWQGVYNLAIGGANICGPYTPGNGEPRNLIYQIREAANNLADVCYAEGELDNGVYVKKVDYVFISMGYNDANNGYTYGTLDSVKESTWSSLAPADDTTNFSTIARALKYCLFYLKNTVIEGTIDVNGVTNNVALDMRHAKIIFQTPIATTSTMSVSSDYADGKLDGVAGIVTDICNYYGIPVVNGRKMCGFSREEEHLVQGGKYLKDGVHPNDAGNKKLGEMNLGAILSHF